MIAMIKQTALQRRRWGRVRRRDRRGAATVEFAVAAPILLTLVLGTIDVGQLANVGQRVGGASAAASREAAKASVDTLAEVEACAKGFLAERYPQLSDSELDSAMAVAVYDSNGTEVSDLSTIDMGDPMSIAVTFSFDSVRWLTGVGLGQNRTLEETTVVRRE
jgi:Flp pilus assembly protein TadG